MFGLGTVTRIYVATGTTDMRLSVRRPPKPCYWPDQAVAAERAPLSVREQTARSHENLLLRWIERVGLCPTHGGRTTALANIRRRPCATDPDGVCDAYRGHGSGRYQEAEVAAPTSFRCR